MVHMALLNTGVQYSGRHEDLQNGCKPAAFEDIRDNESDSA